ncbi:hypothetical protein [Agromyces sp. NPDC058126]|uniref:hypothetical protein n=1 Tax=Agromyces sp. NPDC058126 TaxID=3346350 RepID=UPI0036DF4349
MTTTPTSLGQFPSESDGPQLVLCSSCGEEVPAEPFCPACGQPRTTDHDTHTESDPEPRQEQSLKPETTQVAAPASVRRWWPVSMRGRCIAVGVTAVVIAALTAGTVWGAGQIEHAAKVDDARGALTELKQVEHEQGLATGVLSSLIEEYDPLATVWRTAVEAAPMGGAGERDQLVKGLAELTSLLAAGTEQVTATRPGSDFPTAKAWRAPAEIEFVSERLDAARAQIGQVTATTKELLTEDDFGTAWAAVEVAGISWMKTFPADAAVQLKKYPSAGQPQQAAVTAAAAKAGEISTTLSDEAVAVVRAYVAAVDQLKASHMASEKAKADAARAAAEEAARQEQDRWSSGYDDDGDWASDGGETGDGGSSGGGGSTDDGGGMGAPREDHCADCLGGKNPGI